MHLTKDQVTDLSKKRSCPRCDLDKTVGNALCRRCRSKLPPHMRLAWRTSPRRTAEWSATRCAPPRTTSPCTSHRCGSSAAEESGRSSYRFSSGTSLAALRSRARGRARLSGSCVASSSRVWRRPCARPRPLSDSLQTAPREARRWRREARDQSLARSLPRTCVRDHLRLSVDDGAIAQTDGGHVLRGLQLRAQLELIETGHGEVVQQHRLRTDRRVAADAVEARHRLADRSRSRCGHRWLPAESTRADLRSHAACRW